MTPSFRLWTSIQFSTFRSNETLAVPPLVDTVKGVTEISSVRSALPAASAEASAESTVPSTVPPESTEKVTAEKLSQP